MTNSAGPPGEWALFPPSEDGSASETDETATDAAVAATALPVLPPPASRDEQRRIIAALDRDPQFNGGYTAESVDARGALRREGIQQRFAALMEKDDPLRVPAATREADAYLDEYMRRHRLVRHSAGRIGTCGAAPVCVVIDMDCFFASCELADTPSLRGHPVGVNDLGCICTANYTARTYGVGIMGTQRGRELCRRQGVELQTVKCDYAKYGACSRAVQRVLRDDFGLGPERVKVPSMDEMFVDLTGYPANLMDECIAVHPDRTSPSLSPSTPADAMWARVEAFVAAIRARVYARTGLSCSAGMAPTFLAAKICSNVLKPNGQYACVTRRGLWEPALALCPRDLPKRVPAPCFLPRDARAPDERANATGANVDADYDWHRDWFLNLPPGHISGIGPKTQEMLELLEYTSMRALRANRGRLCVLFPKAQARLLLLATEAHQVVREQRAHKQSLSQERSFGRGVPSTTPDGAELIATRLREVSARVVDEMREEQLQGRTVTLKLRMALPHTARDGVADAALNKAADAPRVRTFARTMPQWADDFGSIFGVVRGLMAPHYPCVVWLIGVSVSGMRRRGHEGRQPSMLERWVERRGVAPTITEAQLQSPRPPADHTAAASLGRGNSSLCERLWRLPADDPLPAYSRWHPPAQKPYAARHTQPGGGSGKVSVSRGVGCKRPRGAAVAIDLTVGSDTDDDGGDVCIVDPADAGPTQARKVRRC